MPYRNRLQPQRWLAAGAAISFAVALATPSTQASAAPDEQKGGERAARSTYTQVNLVSDVDGRAQVQDDNLVNAWGVAATSTSALWVSNAGTGKATLYTGGIHGGPQNISPLVVDIPGGVPTGMVANPTADFVVTGEDDSSGSARFIFATAAGRIAGWAPNVPATATPPSTQAQNAVVTPGAFYTGLAIAQTDGGSRLYAANFASGDIDVFNGSFDRIITSGNFQDRQLPPRFAPFNVTVLGGKVYVSYAKINAEHNRNIPGAGVGRVDIFNLDGKLLRRLQQHGGLNSPWGLTIAPAGFGEFSGDLLVGNFGDGRIHAYNPNNLRPLGTVRGNDGKPVAIDGLWALFPGNGVEGGTDEVLFTAGPDGEQHGLLGTLSETVV